MPILPLQLPGALAATGQRRRWRRRLRRLAAPAWLGTLRRTRPLSDDYGYDRGRPIDRYYIESFLEENRASIRGRVLEVKDNTYTGRYGSGVSQSDVLDIDATNRRATITADLVLVSDMLPATFDCFVLTQTLQLIYDTRAALVSCQRLLKPGGTLLVTVPAVSRVVPGAGLQTDYWRFTAASCARLFGDVFGPHNVSLRSYGNVLASIAFLTGMAAEELRRNELDVADPYFPVILAVRATKD